MGIAYHWVVQISAKVDYGLEALLFLAQRYLNDPNSLVKGEEIAADHDIPNKFLEGILTELRRGGFIQSQRGASGGYRLSRSPADITVAEVIRTLDGPLTGIRGRRPEQVVYPGSAENLTKVWIALRAAERSVLEEATLERIVLGKFGPAVSGQLGSQSAWESAAQFRSAPTARADEFMI